MYFSSCMIIQNGAIDDVPPPSRWEIPRTPVRVVEHVQLHLAIVPAHNGGGRNSPLQRTPVRIKTPAHPLAHSNKAPMKPNNMERAPIIGKGGRDHHERNKPVLQSGGSDESAQVQEREGGEVVVTISPPIAMSNGEVLHIIIVHT